MAKIFNVTGACKPGLHYMVDIGSRLQQIKKMVDGNAYNERGEEQLSGYLDHYHSRKGYMLSFNFNKNKEIGVKEIQLGDKILIEAVV